MTQRGAFADDSVFIPVSYTHLDVYKRQLCERTDVTEENVDEILRGEVGRIFTCVLENAGVFKRDADGRAAFRRFAESL